MNKWYCTSCDTGFYAHISADCPHCGCQGEDYDTHRQLGFVGVDTLQKAVAILGRQLISWKYAHRPLLENDWKGPVDSHHVYFVNDQGDEVAAWSLRLASLQIFNPPRKVDRSAFPDGPAKVYVDGQISKII